MAINKAKNLVKAYINLQISGARILPSYFGKQLFNLINLDISAIEDTIVDANNEIVDESAAYVYALLDLVGQAEYLDKEELAKAMTITEYPFFF
jgi:hypothetical protein